MFTVNGMHISLTDRRYLRIWDPPWSALPCEWFVIVKLVIDSDFFSDSNLKGGHLAKRGW